MQIDIWSDIACPWCYIGKRRFEAALAEFEHRDEVTVTWRSFELDRDAPAERPHDGPTHLSQKYGVSIDEARAMNARLTAVAAADGLDYHLETLRLGNSFDAHRLTHLAAAHGAQQPMVERLMHAYLVESELMSDHATLARLAADVGLPADEVAETLATERFAEDVRHDERLAATLGISAVPCFVADRTMGISGAHEPSLLLKFLRKAWEASPAAAAS
jgi:predicted DsbA family dithiol-disulfide isomerase